MIEYDVTFYTNYVMVIMQNEEIGFVENWRDISIQFTWHGGSERQQQSSDLGFESIVYQISEEEHVWRRVKWWKQTHWMKITG